MVDFFTYDVNINRGKVCMREFYSDPSKPWKILFSKFPLAQPSDSSYSRPGQSGGLKMDRRLLEAFYLACQLRGVARPTLTCYAERLALLVKHSAETATPLTLITREEINSYIVNHLGSVSVETINGRIRVWRVFYNFLVAEGVLERSPMQRVTLLKADIKDKPTIPPEVVSKLIDQFDESTFTGCRNKAMVMLAYDSMLRLRELVELRTDSVALLEREVTVQRAKGRRFRKVPFSSRTAYILRRYLSKWREARGGTVLFCGPSGDQLHRKAVANILYRAGDKIGIKLSGHRLRHSAATAYYAAGGPIGILQHILGHADQKTTELYIHSKGEEAKGFHEEFSPINLIRK